MFELKNKFQNAYKEILKEKGIVVGEGEFGAHMEISYTNMGPQTFIWELDGDNFQ